MAHRGCATGPQQLSQRRALTVLYARRVQVGFDIDPSISFLFGVFRTVRAVRFVTGVRQIMEARHDNTAPYSTSV